MFQSFSLGNVIAKASSLVFVRLAHDRRFVGAVAHGNDADNAAEGAQIGCENRRLRALKRAIIAPHENPNHESKVRDAKGGTPNAPR